MDHGGREGHEGHEGRVDPWTVAQRAGVGGPRGDRGPCVEAGVAHSSPWRVLNPSWHDGVGPAASWEAVVAPRPPWGSPHCLLWGPSPSNPHSPSPESLGMVVEEGGLGKGEEVALAAESSHLWAQASWPCLQTWLTAVLYALPSEAALAVEVLN